MTGFRIEEYDFNPGAVKALPREEKLSNWPVVYVLNTPPVGKKSRGSIYFGETLNFSSRMRQHLDNDEKRQRLSTIRVILDNTFNKSACLDLESHLIRYAAGDGTNDVLNRNTGVGNYEYYNREKYTRIFDEIFNELLMTGVFSRSIPEIVNSELFKLSPFKVLNEDQAIAVMDIMEGLIEDLAEETQQGNLVVVEGDPGTGKTVIAVYLMKLISDIAVHRDRYEAGADTMFSEFFVEDTVRLFDGLRIGMVVPQQSLRKSLKNVFDKTPGLDSSMVMTPHEIAENTEDFDILIVDEAHRLNQFSSQPSAAANRRFQDINAALFDGERPQASQLDWLRAKARNLILLLDLKQSVRPQDLPQEEYLELLADVPKDRRYRLHTQMRSMGGNDYISYVYDIFSHVPPTERLSFGDYEVGLVDSPRKLVELVHAREAEHGLSRIVAGYAWPWKSKKDKAAMDIDLGEGIQLQWNKAVVDWVNSPTAMEEAGSIHTIQGYDLNYAGVVIGADLRYDPVKKELFIDRASYHDSFGKQNITVRKRKTTDELLTSLITNIYAVLMTRGIRGTFIHVVDPELRKYLNRYFEVIG
ncbi:DUF2075 domain-containing protein [Corynebacterium sp. YIM 101645]|uniref:DUF2075 domain-containing protein n=1 Tax=Corynebacterium lemuris TaxID=1859292 RepID=A0ABT2FXJ4_9CORY|nr:DUF2075 domain-containing protein [Corynebacterium lemuris]MCS5479967.1 DUF2075 domain-containing protein [Corynebacterium lemuris]